MHYGTYIKMRKSLVKMFSVLNAKIRSRLSAICWLRAVAIKSYRSTAPTILSIRSLPYRTYEHMPEPYVHELTMQSRSCQKKKWNIFVSDLHRILFVNVNVFSIYVYNFFVRSVKIIKLQQKKFKILNLFVK